MQTRILSEIWIYPVKSLGGIRLSTANVMEKGLQYDRRWMLVDENGKFLTQRTTPKMALFALKSEGNGFWVTYGDDAVLLPTEDLSSGKIIKAQVWGDSVEVLEANMAINAWFSERLEMSCRLVSFPEENPRLIDPHFRIAKESVSLADGYPMLIIGQASLDDLNKRLETPVPTNRFRPNLVFTEGEPYEEDAWKEFSVGTNRFMGVKPCARCVLTTVDQATGVKGREPLLTLSRYRKQGDKITPLLRKF